MLKHSSMEFMEFYSTIQLVFILFKSALDPCLSMVDTDMICQLPDDVLISIISLIPTKEALCTTILSKRWRNLFRFVPTLTFLCKCDSYSCTHNPEAFINGVHGVLQHHSAHVHSFEFYSCLPKSSTQTFKQFIFSLRDLGIQKLKLQLKFCYSKFPFSCHLLSLLPSLQYLKLTEMILQPGLKNHCNSLKTIRLSYVAVSPGSIECILSNCLNLCKLTLKLCSVPSTLCFPRLNLQLKFIFIYYCHGLEEICFYAPNLRAFDFYCHNRVNLIFDNVPQLPSVYLNSPPGDVPYYCGVLGKCLPSLKTLLLDNIGDLYEDGSISRGINMFSKLKRLELSVYNGDFNLYSLIRVVHGCPRLEEFQLATGFPEYLWPEEEEQVIVHSQLKVVEISGFGGSESEFEFASYIHKSAIKLEQLTISWYMSVYAGFGGRIISDFPPTYVRRCKHLKVWPQVYERIQQMKHEAISKTLQLVAQEFPKIKPKQF